MDDKAIALTIHVKMLVKLDKTQIPVGKYQEDH
jgi:hypothetical protein